MLLEKASVAEGMCCCSIPVGRANFAQTVNHPLGKEELDAFLILAPGIKSRMILCAEDENYHTPMEQPKRNYPYLPV